VAEIRLSNGQVAIVDDDRADLGALPWFVCNGYAAHKRGKKIYMHRVVMNAQPGQYVDHINGNRLDNRRANLRLCSNAENVRHQVVKPGRKRAAIRSRFKGVYWQAQNGNWVASINTDKYKSTHLGCFTDEVEAAVAYNMAALEFHGEYASFNRNLLEV
jgi:uncharacterized protein YdbL (DUF1318 family)